MIELVTLSETISKGTRGKGAGKTFNRRIILALDGYNLILGESTGVNIIPQSFHGNFQQLSKKLTEVNCDNTKSLQLIYEVFSKKFNLTIEKPLSWKLIDETFNISKRTHTGLLCLYSQFKTNDLVSDSEEIEEEIESDETKETAS